MNARSFLGQDKINELTSQGLTPLQIKEYAKKEYFKSQNLGIDGKPIPSAPIVSNKPKAPDGFVENAIAVAKDFGEGVKSFGKGVKRTANSIWEDSVFGDYGTGASDADKIKSDIARAQNTQGLIKTLAQSDESRAANNERLAQTYDKLAKDRGYDLGAIIEGDKIYFGKTGENGQIHTLDATPNFTNQISANKGEIMGGAAGALLPGGVPVKMLSSALGSGAGAGIDYANRAENINEKIDPQALLMRALEGASDDLAAGGALMGVGAGAKVLKEPAKIVANKGLDLASKLSDFGIVGVAKDTIKGLPSANVSGAKNIAKAIAGDEAELMQQNAKNVGGYNVDNGNFTDIRVLNKPINFIKEHLASTAQKLKLDDVSNAINNAKGVNAAQSELVDLSLSDSKMTGRVINALRGDATGQGARNLADLAQSDVNAVREVLPKGVKGELSQNFKDYYARVGDDFGRAEQEISQAMQGKTTTLNANAIDEAKSAMLKGMNTFDAKSPEASQLIESLETLKDIPLSFDELRKLKTDFNQYAQRIFNKNPSYNTIIDTASVGKVIDNAIDNLIGDSGLKSYYKEALNKYSAMKNLQDNPLLKKIIDGNASSDEILKAVFDAEKSQADVLHAFTKELNKDELAKFETELLTALFDSRIATRGKLNPTELLDGIGLKEDLQKINFKSKEAQDIKDALINLANARGDFATIFNHIEKEFIAPSRPRPGIAQTPEGMLKSVAINKLKQSVFKYIGKWGDDGAFEYHLKEGFKALKANQDLGYFKQAVKRSGASDEMAEAMTKAVKDELGGRIQEASRLNEEHIKQIVKDVSKNKEWALKLDPKADILGVVRDFSKPIKTPIFESKISFVKMLNHLADKSDFERRIEYINLVKPTLEDPLFIVKDGDRYRFVKTFVDSKDKVVKFLSVVEDDKGNFIGITATPIKNTDLKNILKGDIVWGGNAPTSQGVPQTAKRLDADRNIIPQSEIKSKKSLKSATKEIKDNPTHFFKNNNDDMALIAKQLNNGKIGKIAVVKESGKIGHLSKSTNKKELERLKDVNNRELGVGAPHPTLQRTDNNQVRLTAGEKSRSLATNSIIPQSKAKGKASLESEAKERVSNAISKMDDNPKIGEIMQKTLESKDISVSSKVSILNASIKKIKENLKKKGS
ncbi:hypothetical protein CCAL9344_07950 [Campylobacter sp. RM9344]|uniref:Phage-Barnase-EndoU-ColicinE5/D-RelE like nuclease 2 domain-containing protein n=1 Tax=Campylobacter californiensis TaxID=1032243 RepID=A0AAW3ZZ13_9BACT|nr:PBECR2 nuclease fold domain-containing protein [Campylobacter sp. RM9337]MBE3030110.1 hypothetical protein [Campylobacter sp. RM9344]MBE3608770.1 hypothetical protein [Campylobacter sp. RM9337]